MWWIYNKPHRRLQSVQRTAQLKVDVSFFLAASDKFLSRNFMKLHSYLVLINPFLQYTNALFDIRPSKRLQRIPYNYMIQDILRHLHEEKEKC